MSATVTATGSAGPNKTITVGVFTDIQDVIFHTLTNVLELVDIANKSIFIAITSATTITATKSGSTYTFIVS